jgi:hypothetical protein
MRSRVAHPEIRRTVVRGAARRLKRATRLTSRVVCQAFGSAASMQ